MIRIVKVKCPICGAVYEGTNKECEDDHSFTYTYPIKCPNECSAIRIDSYGTYYCQGDYKIENVSSTILFEDDDYLVPDEELNDLIEKIKQLKDIRFYDSDAKDDFGNERKKYIDFYFTCKTLNSICYERNEIQLNLCFLMDDYNNITIDKLMKDLKNRCRNYINIYKYISDKDFEIDRKEFEKIYYNQLDDWSYTQKKVYDVEYYI